LSKAKGKGKGGMSWGRTGDFKEEKLLCYDFAMVDK
jgi:hypothetical protein